MIHLHSPQQLHPNIPFYIGIAINGDSEQRHIGILFRTDIKDEPKLLHLAFHQLLTCDLPHKYSGKYYWLQCPEFDEDEQLQLAVWFNKVFTKNGNKIPYGLAYSSTGYFSPSGDFINSEKGCGLTCATFIMSLFNDFGFPIIDIDSWEQRTDDADWHNKIVQAMKDHRNNHPELYSDTHIDDQIKNIGVALRFRPEEVAASVYVYNETPVIFQQAKQLGENILFKMGIPEKPDI